MKNLLLLNICLLLLMGCGDMLKNEEEKAGDRAVTFAEAYFNYDLQRAQTYVTAESKPWLSFMASNINQTDLDVLNDEENKADVELVSLNLDNDTLGRALLNISHSLLLDSVGGGHHFVDNTEVALMLVKRNGAWLVNLNGLILY